MARVRKLRSELVTGVSQPNNLATFLEADMNKTWRAMVCAMVLGVALPLLANAADVSIEPQPLGSALQDLAKQSGVQIIFLSKAVEGRRAPALNGTYTPEEAVAVLLEGSGLTYHALNERAIEVAEKPVAPAPS